MAQKPARLRYPEGESMGDRRHRAGRAAAIAQKGDEVAGRRIADAHHRRTGRLVPDLVNLERGKTAARRQQPDRALIDKLPALRRDLGAGVALAVAHGEPRFFRVGRHRRVAEPHDIAVARRARADVEFVADAAHHRPAAFDRGWEACRHAVVDPRRSRIPARPDEAPAAPEGKAETDILCHLRVVGVGVAPGFVEPAEDHLAAAIGHVIDEHPARGLRLGRPQDEEIGLVLDHAAGIPRRLVEIDDDPAGRCRRIDFALGNAGDPHIGSGRAKGLSLGEGFGRIHRDFGNSHQRAPVPG